MKTQTQVNSAVSALKKEYEQELDDLCAKYRTKIAAEKSLVVATKAPERHNNPIQHWIYSSLKKLPKKFTRNKAVELLQNLHPGVSFAPMSVGQCLTHLSKVPDSGISCLSHKRHTGNIYTRLPIHAMA